MRMQNGYPYEPSEMKSPPFNKSFFTIHKLSDNNVSDDGL